MIVCGRSEGEESSSKASLNNTVVGIIAYRYKESSLIGVARGIQFA